MQVLNPDYAAVVRRMFAEAPFVEDVGIKLTAVGPGWCESELLLLPRHMQHSGTAHAGVQATIADHTAGAAATTVIAADQRVLSAEFKINLLRPGLGQQLHCRAAVLKAGRALVIVEAEVFALRGDSSTLIAKAMFTMAVLTAR